MIFGTNTTRDISKLPQISISKYQSWYLCQVSLQIMLLPIECFHSRGQHLCKFIKTKESVCIRKEFNSHKTGLGHQHGRLEIRNFSSSVENISRVSARTSEIFFQHEMLFSHVKMSSFRAKAHLVFYWCLYNKLISSICMLLYPISHRLL